MDIVVIAPKMIKVNKIQIALVLLCFFFGMINVQISLKQIELEATTTKGIPGSFRL